MRKVIRIFSRSLLFRFCLKLAFKKLNVIKALKEFVPVVQFALGMTLFNIIFHLVRRVVIKNREASE